MSATGETHALERHQNASFRCDLCGIHHTEPIAPVRDGGKKFGVVVETPRGAYCSRCITEEYDMLGLYLTDRELETAIAWFAGMDETEISECLKISHSTVKSYKTKIRKRVDEFESQISENPIIGELID